MTYVRQEDYYGCGIACLAMLTGQTYQAVKAALPFDLENGLIYMVLDDYLQEHGYAVRRQWQHSQWRNKQREEWPPAPFADMHLVQVNTVNGGHYLVMLGDGTVLDPAHEGRFTLADPCYPIVNSVAGVYKVGP